MAIPLHVVAETRARAAERSGRQRVESRPRVAAVANPSDSHQQWTLVGLAIVVFTSLALILGGLTPPMPIPLVFGVALLLATIMFWLLWRNRPEFAEPRFLRWIVMMAISALTVSSFTLEFNLGDGTADIKAGMGPVAGICIVAIVAIYTLFVMVKRR